MAYEGKYCSCIDIFILGAEIGLLVEQLIIGQAVKKWESSQMRIFHCSFHRLKISTPPPRRGFNLPTRNFDRKDFNCLLVWFNDEYHFWPV